MAGMAALLITLTGIAAYIVASILSVGDSFRPSPSREHRALVLAVLGSVLLTSGMIIHGLDDGRSHFFGSFQALTCYALAVSFIYFALKLGYHLHGVASLMMPFITVISIIAAGTINSGSELMGQLPDGWLALHACSALVAYASFTVAAVLAIIYLIQDYNLRHKHFGSFFEQLPSLDTLDHIMRQQIGFGFLVFSISIIIGFVMIRLNADLDKWVSDPKIAATAATWVVYAFLMHARTSADLHGRRMAIVTIAALLFVAFSFIGIHLVTDSHHSFVLLSSAGKP